MNRLLGAGNIEDIVGIPCNVMAASELHKIRDVDDLFKKSNKTLILYDDKRQGNQVIGHWCALKRHNYDISFYDPYGGFIDDQYNFIDPEYRRLNNLNRRHLSNLLYYSPYRLHYNPYQHQRLRDGINTCGRHCALFLLNEYEPEKFNKIYSELSKETGMDKDKLSVKLTNPFLI